MTNEPYATLPTVPSFTLTSSSFKDGDRLSSPQVSGMIGTGGGDRAPALRWSDAPEETKSFALSCLDPDAPTGSGFWHLAAYNIPASLTSLEEGFVTLESATGLPDEAELLRNDAGVRGFVGAAPPPGHGDHRYIFVVHALDVEALQLDDLASPALLGFEMFGHTLGRGILTGIFGH